MSDADYDEAYRDSRVVSSSTTGQTTKVAQKSSTVSSRPGSGLVKGKNRVYVVNIPSHYPSDAIETEIKMRLEKTYHLKGISVTCFNDLGIGIIDLTKSDEKKYLLEDVEAIIIDKTKNVILRFAEDVTIDCFIIIQIIDGKSINSNNIKQMFIDRYKLDESLSVDAIGSKFPNIYRLNLKNVIEYNKVGKNPTFKTESCSFKSYIDYDCSFLEDIPRRMESNELVSIILSQSRSRMENARDYYVQIDKSSSTAVILAKTSVCKDWIDAVNLSIDGNDFPKRKTLSYRLIVHPVPNGYDVRKIRGHVLLREKVLSHKRIADCIIVEVDGADTYHKCLEIGAINIDDHLMRLKQHITVDDPDSTDIDEMTWYETTMPNLKESFLQIIKKSNNPIFRYRWNANKWIQQIDKTKSTGGNLKASDHIRHLLRVTVMLNTVGVLWKQKYFIGKTVVELKTKRLKTIVYYHDSLVFPKMTVTAKGYETPFDSTEVKVIESDCLTVYEELAGRCLKPVLLNMANAESPGGGYRKGDAAQEENIFRRSDYYRSLDVEASGREHSDFMYYDADNNIKKISGLRDLYPMEEFGAIYTAGITVFRHSEDNGYEFMDKPLHDVHSIAMAAYREPKLTDENRLVDEFAIKTLKKIENILAIAYHQKHDCLVLSAFGCGAFKNPPNDIALLFKSAIQQYAGFFKCIYFAIINDHNTKGKTNPDGNVAPFKEVLHKKKFYPPKTLGINMMIGPRRIIQKSGDGLVSSAEYKILDKLPCHHGSKCRQIRDEEHLRKCSHPPFCGIQERPQPCPEIEDSVHEFTYRHTSSCSAGADCKESEDSVHMMEFDHPKFCKQGYKCQNTETKHLASFRHLPTCKDCVTCKLYLRNDEKHIQLFRHVKAHCPDDNCCQNFFDENHVETMTHTFKKVCPFTPYNCDRYILYIQRANNSSVPKDVEQHCLTYAHICPFGRLCRELKNPAHLQINIHVARNMCDNDISCLKLKDEDHLESSTHSNIRDIRLMCREAGHACPDTAKYSHVKQYRHAKNLRYPGVVPAANTDLLVNYVQNQKNMMASLKDYMLSSGWKNMNPPKDLVNWVLALKPAHRCRSHIFESILEFGHVMSIDYMKNLNRSKHVSGAVMNHPEIRALFLKHENPGVKKKTKELVMLMVRIELMKDETGVPDGKDDNLLEDVKVVEHILRKLIMDDVETIKRRTMKIIQSAIKLKKNPMGIGFDVDVEIETNKYVFSIIGPHTGYYYGDVVIIFRQELMYHPHSYFTPQAGTSFMSGRTFTHRPWISDPTDKKQRAEIFHQSKLSCAVAGFEQVALLELAAITGFDKKSVDVDTDSVSRRWCQVDSHQVFEGHLPPLIPLDYIDKVYIPKKLFHAMSDEAQTTAKTIFGESLILTEYDVDLTLEKSGNILAMDDNRKKYLEYILKESLEDIKKGQNSPSHLRGFTMTLAGSNFEQHMLIPMKISDSYQLHRASRKHAPDHPDVTYIYWQVMNGDMMLTIATEPIKLHEDQTKLRTLVCYIAEKPAKNKTDYHEEYSYVNDDHPATHFVRVEENRFKAKSNRFLVGCNNENFLTFCLEIDYKRNEATMYHVGSNSIYNHRKISYSFDKKKLDLSHIDYIHVSAGKKDVPIRQLRVTHQKISELHVTSDKNFKIDTVIIQDHRIDDDKKEKPDTGIERKPATPASHIPVPKLPPCRDSIYCLLQASKNHLEEYSHPCRFNELCAKQQDEPHMIHNVHNSPTCRNNRDCQLLHDPVHRSKYRHRGLPDFLTPCRLQDTCKNKDSDHRSRFFHGEEIPGYPRGKNPSKSAVSSVSSSELKPCRHGAKCWAKNDSSHRTKFSHPSE